MAIHYGLYETSGIAASEKKIVARPKIKGRLTTEDLARQIEGATSATRGDVLLALSALTDYMADGLLNGLNVTLDGLGTFSVSMEGEVRPDKNGKPVLHDASVRKVHFRPCRELMRKMGKASFTSQNTEAHHSASLTDEEVRQRTTETLTGREAVGFDELRKVLGMTVSTARRRLKVLVDDGTIRRVGTRAKALFALN